MKPKMIFFGTQNFGAGILSCLIGSGQYDIVAVITQPDRKIGRKQEIQGSPVKILAEQYGLKILQPDSLKDPGSQIPDSDLAVVCEYGLIIPKSVLETAKRGFINVHTSLLPKYRGASPIQTAIVNGETETGVTIMLMDEKMDRGPILSQEKVVIAQDDTYLVLAEKMLPVAQKLLIETLPKYLKGETRPVVQDESEATFCKMLTREDGKIDWQRSTAEIYNQFRGLTPWPGVWTIWDGKRLKLLTIKPADAKLPAGMVKIVNGQILVGAADGSIEILSLQLEGKKEQAAANFIVGYPKFRSAGLK